MQNGLGTKTAQRSLYWLRHHRYSMYIRTSSADLECRHGTGLLLTTGPVIEVDVRTTQSHFNGLHQEFSWSRFGHWHVLVHVRLTLGLLHQRLHYRRPSRHFVSNTPRPQSDHGKPCKNGSYPDPGTQTSPTGILYIASHIAI